MLGYFQGQYFMTPISFTKWAMDPKSHIVARRSFNSERMSKKWRYIKQFRAIRDLNP